MFTYSMCKPDHDIPLDQGCPILHLKGHLPANFSSNTLAWKFLEILVLDTLIIWNESGSGVS